MIELLSPAGNMQSLKAALLNGADAVYFGGSLFNARLGAKNFSNDSIKEAIDLCHKSNARAFVTMNTLIHDRDLYSAVSFAAYLYECGVDAVIVQDIGLVSLIRKYIPNLEIHASTQMGISTLSGVKLCEELGIRRVVLSRELSLKDIEYISRNSKMPLEVFVHGAMCMSFSGGCLFSSMVGSRSGNCGTCAQPCRKYAAIDKIPNEKELALSLGDLCMIDHINELEKAGACSLKIEGRMKKPEYIAAVTHAYRRAIDGADKKEIAELKKEMNSVFSRGEFTTGYYFGDSASCDRIASANPPQELLEKIRNRKNTVKNEPVSFSLIAKKNEPTQLIAKTLKKTVTVTGDIAQEPQKPITDDTISRYKEQLTKLGDTGFVLNEAAVFATGFVPISSINALRREACLLLSESKKREKIQLPSVISLPKAVSDDTKRQLTLKVTNISQAIAAFNEGASEVILEYGCFSADEISALQKYRNKAQLGIALPISLVSLKSQKRLLDTINPNDFDLIEINNLGQLEFARSFKRIIGGIHLNVFNAHTAIELLNMGIDRLLLSVELTLPQLMELLKFIPREKVALFTYGRVPLMNLFHCPIKEHIGCKNCKKNMHRLYDSEKREFLLLGMPAHSDCELVKLYNCYPLDVLGLLEKHEFLPKTLYMSFTDESHDIISDRAKAAFCDSPKPLPNTTRGYFNR